MQGGGEGEEARRGENGDLTLDITSVCMCRDLIDQSLGDCWTEGSCCAQSEIEKTWISQW